MSMGMHKKKILVVDDEEAKEIVSILMESPLYLDLPLIDRLKLIRRTISKVHLV